MRISILSCGASHWISHFHYWIYFMTSPLATNEKSETELELKKQLSLYSFITHDHYLHCSFLSPHLAFLDIFLYFSVLTYTYLYVFLLIYYCLYSALRDNMQFLFFWDCVTLFKLCVCPSILLKFCDCVFLPS